MTVFRVPGDFPLISVAVDSPLVKAGDTILVEDGACDEEVFVPADKFGLRIMADGDSATLDGEGDVNGELADQGDDDAGGASASETEVEDDALTGVSPETDVETVEENEAVDEPESVLTVPPEAASDPVMPENQADDASLDSDGNTENDLVENEGAAGNQPETGTPWLEESGATEASTGEKQGDTGDGAPAEEDLSGPFEDIVAPVEELAADPGAMPESRPEDQKAYVTVTSGVPRMFKPGSGSPYWVVVRRNK